MRILHFLILPLLAFSVFAQNIEIMGFCGVPESESCVARFEEMRGAGFTISIQNYSSVPAAQKALACAEKAGMRLILSTPEVSALTPSAIKNLAQSPALYAYYIKDEPRREEMEALAQKVEALRRIDPAHPAYVNLLPHYDGGYPFADDAAFKEYLRASRPLKLPYLSFDFYPVTTSGLRQVWFRNLKFMQQEAATQGVPLWAFSLATPHAVYPTPTINALRLQIFTNLAYGAKAIQYFTYWTPPHNADDYFYHDGPIDAKGRQTDVYQFVRQANAEVQWYAPLLADAVVQQVGHVGLVPTGCDAFRIRRNQPLRGLSIQGGKERPQALVSQMRTRKDGTILYLIINTSLSEPLTLHLRFQEGALRRVITAQQSAKAEKSYTLAPGNMILLRN